MKREDLFKKLMNSESLSIEDQKRLMMAFQVLYQRVVENFIDLERSGYVEEAIYCEELIIEVNHVFEEMKTEDINESYDYAKQLEEAYSNVLPFKPKDT